MPLTVATLFSARGDTSNTATYVAPNFTPTIGCLLLGWVANSKSSVPDTPAISDGRFTWTRIASKNSGSLNILHVFRAMAGTGGTTPAQGGATIGFPASQTGCAWGFVQISGVPNSSDGSSAIIQYGSSNTGTDVTTSTTTLSALNKPSNAVFSGLSIGVNATPTKETAYTAAATHPGYNTPASRLGMSWLISADTEVTPSWSWTGVVAPGEIALEVISYGTNRSITTSLGTLGLGGPRDTFSSDSNPLASPWGAVGYTAGNLRALSGACIKTSPASETDNAMHYTGAGSISEQYSKFEYTSGSDIGLLCRSTATQCYQMNLVGGSIAAFHQWTSAGGWSFSVVSNIGIPALSSGEGVMFAVTGTTGAATFTMYRNGSNVGSRVYTTGAVLVNGYPGIQMYSADSPSVDNWAGGPITRSKGLNWWSQLADAVSGAVTRTISKISSIANSAKRSQWLGRTIPEIRPITYAAKRLQNVIKTISLARSRAIALARAVIYSRTISEIFNRVFSVRRVGWFGKSIPISRNLTFTVKRIGQYIKKLSPSRDIRQLVSRSKLSIRSIAVARSIADSVKRIGNFIRSAASIRNRAISVSRKGWLIRWNALVRSSTLAVKRIANYKKTMSVARSLLNRVGRVAVFARTISVARSLRSIIEREWALFVRRVAMSKPMSFSVKRIGQYIRRISVAVSRLVAVGRSISGQLTLRSVATIKAVSLSVKRIATYKKTIGITRALLFTVGRWRVSIRTISTTRTLLDSAKRISWRIRSLANIRALTLAVKRIAWYKRPISLARPVSLSVKRISQIGRRVSTATRSTFGLIWHVAGALTTRTIRVTTRATYSITRLSWRIRRAATITARTFSVRYIRFLKRYVAFSGTQTFSIKRVGEYIRRVSLGIRNNFAVLYLITSVLRIWKAISSSYSNASASSSSSKKIEVSSNSRQKERVS